MFMQEKDVLLSGIAAVGDAHCCYLGGPDWQSRRCDCKYGVGDPHKGGSEVTGCPELREAYALIDAMTEHEFTRLVKRSGGVITMRLFRNDRRKS